MPDDDEAEREVPEEVVLQPREFWDISDDPDPVDNDTD